MRHRRLLNFASRTFYSAKSDFNHFPPLHREANANLKMLILEILVVLLALSCTFFSPNVFLWFEDHPQAEGLIESKQTYNCCTSLEVLLSKDEGCEDRFSVWDMTLALVKGPHAEVQAPFKLLRGREVMQVLDCVDFSHQRVCDLEDIYVEERNTDYESRPCTKDL